MRDTIATASRDVLAIKRRQLSYLLFRGPQEILRRRRPVDSLTTAAFAPEVTDEATLGDLLNRLGWYFPRGSVDDRRLYVQTDLDPEAAKGETPDSQDRYPVDHLPVEFVPTGERLDAAGDVDALALHDASARFSTAALRHLRCAYFLDPTFYSGVEAGTWGAFSDLLRHDVENDSARLFEGLEARSEGTTRAYVFATGPSLDEAMAFDFEDDALKIICNSIVRDDELLEHLDPDVLVFSDDVFHFGPSKYAATFREDMAETLTTYDCVAAVPERFRSLIAGHYPELEFVGIRGRSMDEPNFPTSDGLEVMSTGNIMTLLMLPIASALADEVYVVGADGRKEDESYFWEHNDDAQYDDELMKTAVDCHPSFFRDRVYSDYYDQHVQTLANFLEYGEERGVTYGSLTESYVPCLAERFVDPQTVGLR